MYAKNAEQNSKHGINRILTASGLYLVCSAIGFALKNACNSIKSKRLKKAQSLDANAENSAETTARHIGKANADGIGESIAAAVGNWRLCYGKHIMGLTCNGPIKFFLMNITERR